MQRSSSGLVDWTLVLSVLALTGIGLLSIYSATFNAGMPTYFYKQLLFAGVGIVVGAFLMFLPSRWLEVTSWIWYGISIALLVAVLFVGKVVNGQKNWIVIGSLSFQPSEFAKLGVLLAVARVIARPNVNLQTIRDLFFVFVLIAVPFGLVILEPDFGSATVYAGLFLGIALWCGADAMLLFACVTPAVAAVTSLFGTVSLLITLAIIAASALLFRRSMLITATVILINIGVGYGMPWTVANILKPHQQARIAIFLDANKDPRGQGYNVVQSTMAVGSGGLFGKGFQQGTQTQLRYIPKQWTDFIYCVPTEEFGFVGGTLVILLLLGICARVVKIASLIRAKFESTVAIGIASLWCYHGAVNIGMAVGLLPVIGIPLPFMSAGGTSLVLNLAMTGIVLGFYRQVQMSFDSSAALSSADDEAQ